MNELIYSVSDFVGLLNQTLEYAYPNVTIVGELASFRISKNKWVYFDLKDEYASVRFFGTVYSLPGPLEDGLLLQVRGVPKLHPNFGFSVTIQAIQPVGEGSLKRAAALLEAKLEKEGLFDIERKRQLPFPPKRIGLITSKESAAYTDFVKILNERWSGLEILLFDTQVQGEAAIEQIVTAVAECNALAEPPEVLVITRGGGSAEDLAVFNTEQVTQAVAASRVPTLVAVGHEIDISLAERAADQRASTPSNAAQLLVPDARAEKQRLAIQKEQLKDALNSELSLRKKELEVVSQRLHEAGLHFISELRQLLLSRKDLLEALSPKAVLRRGYAILRSNTQIIRSVKKMQSGKDVSIQLYDGTLQAKINGIEVQ